MGTVQYVMKDDLGKEFTLEVQAYWVPELKQRLVSPQDLHTANGNLVFFQSYPGFQDEDRYATFEVRPASKGYASMPALQTCTMQFHKRNNLPIHKAQLPRAEEHAAKALSAAICETSKHNQNLDNAQKELLHWHSSKTRHTCSSLRQYW